MNLPTSFRALDMSTISKEQLLDLWHKVEREDYCFDDMTRGDLAAFVSLLAAPTTLVYAYGEQAMVMFTNLIPTLRGEVHQVVFDKQINLRAFLADFRSLIEFVMEAGMLQRLTAFVSAQNSYGNRVAVQTGFTLEGTMRKFAPVHGKLEDVNVYGRIKE